ncbi:MAG: efflux RND transporter permease subunit [Bacteriovoracaceae bacterium]|nr:efflux RND transporter permease subunit [Bacteroidota bacterium]
MSLSAVSIRRPVLAIVMSLAIILFGIIGYTYLGIREYPSVAPATISVSTSYVGANADVIESQITERLEQSISGIAGIRTMSSVSREGRSSITVEFELGVDLEAAANDVRDKVSSAQRFLPADCEPPIVSKADADAVPIILLNIKSSNRSMLELTEIAEVRFKEFLQTIPGVSEARVWGAKTYAMRLWMDPSKLSAYQLTPIDVQNAVRRENVELPSGRIEGQSTELTVRTLSRLQTPEDFNNMIVKEINGRVIRFRDIGTAELGPENLRSIMRRDGIPSVGVVVQPRAGANYVEIVDEFRKRVEDIKRDLPSDVETGYGFDTSKYIRQSIVEVTETVVIAFVLVFLVIYFFLRDIRTTIIPMIAVPVSLIGSFFIMYLMDFSINVLTLLGIVLAIGLVVDDAIVILENIFAKIEGGMQPYEAGVKGSAEVYFAVIATTVTLAAVFMPVVFLQGLTGRLFKEFGIVLAGSVVISAFVALTLTPMMSSRILKPHAHHSAFYRMTEPFFVWVTATYRELLQAFMQRRWLGVAGVAISIAMIIGFGALVPSELAPLEDRSSLRVTSTGPEGVTFEYMDTYVERVVASLQQNVPEISGNMSLTSPGFGGSGSVNSSAMFINLKEPADRERTQTQIANQINGLLRQFPEARGFAIQEQSIGGRGGGLPVQFVIQAQNFEKLREALPKFLTEAQQRKEFQIVDVNLKFNRPEVRIEINRDRARALGVSAFDIAQTLQLAYSGQRFDFFVMNGKQYQVIGQMSRESRNKPLDLKSLFVRNSRGELIQLDNVITLREETSPPALYRYNRYVSATVSAGLAPGYTVGDGISVMRNVADTVLDETFSTALSGTSLDFEESSSSLLFAFVLALILIYLVLSAQFESFRDPFIIMFTVPLALAGALFSLWYFNLTLNIFSQIGVIMLIGLVTKNGILIVEFANQRKSQGLSLMDAIVDASVARFRPILMTSFSTILGTLPIALALGAGSESRVSMGIAVIGGLVFSTFLTLFIIPSLYSYVSRATASVSNTEDALAENISGNGIEVLEQNVSR